MSFTCQVQRLSFGDSQWETVFKSKRGLSSQLSCHWSYCGIWPHATLSACQWRSSNEVLRIHSTWAQWESSNEVLRIHSTWGKWRSLSELLWIHSTFIDDILKRNLKKKNYTQCIKNLLKKGVFMRVFHNEPCQKYILNFLQDSSLMILSKLNFEKVLIYFI